MLCRTETKHRANQRKRGGGEDKENYDKVLYEILRKLEYHNTRLDRHDRKFLDVYVDLKDKYLSIGRIQEYRVTQVTVEVRTRTRVVAPRLYLVYIM